MSFPEQPTGSTHGQPPTQPVWVPPRRRGRAPFVVLAVVIAVLLVAGGGLAAWLLTRPSSAAGGTAAPVEATSSAAASPTSSPAPRASSKRLDEHATCNAIVPLLTKTADLLTAYAKHQPWDRGAAEQLFADLDGVAKVAPVDMHADLGSQTIAIAGVLSGTGFDRDRTVDAGVRLGERCRKYATG